MYRDNKIGLVIPAYNEERLIGPTLAAVPDYIDCIYVVDDCSPDNQISVIQNIANQDSRIILLRHEFNKGPGAAIITGYRCASKENCDIVVVCGGDNQMPLAETTNLLNPIIDGECDYAKGNRFSLSTIEDTFDKMPKTRLIGNWIITGLVKLASGYYKTMDVVEGFTAISKKAIDTIDWNRAWLRYGYPMDFLIRLNAYGFSIKDVPRTSVYLPGERQSQIKGLHYAISVSPMLFSTFLWRLKFKYLYLSFHPLIFLFLYAIFALPTGLAYGFYLIYRQFISLNGVSGPQAIFCVLLIITGFQSLISAMLLDMEENK